MAQPKSLDPIRGVFAALATPRRPNSTEVDTAAFFDYQDAVVRARVDGLVLFGATGEFVHFDISDRMRAVSLLRKRVRVPLLINISHSTLEGTLALAESALSAEVAGLLVMPPYFYRYSEAQLLAFYQRFAERINSRGCLFLYNLPFFTNPLSYEVIERLLLSGMYAGIKDSSGDRALFQHLRALHANHPFVWLAGHESLYLEARTAGAAGTVSGIAGALPELIVAIDRAVAANALRKASRLNAFLHEFLLWLNRFPGTIAIKEAAALRGWKVGHRAFPFDEQTNADIKAFHGWLQEWLPKVLAECAEPAAARA
jgi:dihydrodipicolinate synthase/N-acetylneuraminate lyase